VTSEVLAELKEKFINGVKDLPKERQELLLMDAIRVGSFGKIGLPHDPYNILRFVLLDDDRCRAGRKVEDVFYLADNMAINKSVVDFLFSEEFNKKTHPQKGYWISKNIWKSYKSFIANVKENSFITFKDIYSVSNVNLNISVGPHNTNFILMATYQNNQKLVSWLLDNGANPTLQSNSGNCAIRRAIKRGYNKITKLFIENPSVSWDWKDSDGHSPLFIAAKSSNFIAFDMLCEKGLDINELDADGENVISSVFKSDYGFDLSESKKKLKIVKKVLGYEGLIPMDYSARMNEALKVCSNSHSLEDRDAIIGKVEEAKSILENATLEKKIAKVEKNLLSRKI